MKRKKNKLVLWSILSLVLIGIIFLGIYAIPNMIVGQESNNLNVESTSISLVSSDNLGATYSHNVNHQNFGSSYNGYVCASGSSTGVGCAYDIVVQMSQKSSALTDVPGLIQGEWFEGTPTQTPGISTTSGKYSVRIENPRFYLKMVGVDNVIGRYTGDIIITSVSPSSDPPYIYGEFDMSGTGTIPTQAYFDSLEVEEQEEQIIEDKEIVEIVGKDNVIEENTEIPIQETQTETPETQEPIQKSVNTKLITWIVGIIVAILFIVVLFLIFRRK